MRTATQVRVSPGAQKSSQTSIPAPVGGLNARDSIANMPMTDAAVLENWFPTTTSVDVRKGFAAWSTFTGVCQTALVYNGLTQTKVFSAVKSGATFSIFDSTSSGAVGAAAVGGGGATIEALTNTRFDYVNYGTAGGQYLIAVNGNNNPLQFDGTNWTVSGLTGGTPANYASIMVYKKRLFVIEKNSFVVRYWPVDTIAGASATALNLGSVFKLGGHLIAAMSIADDGIVGLTDYIAFLSSEGEIVAYTGEDPSSVSTWSLAAHLRIGRPVIFGNRTWCKWGTDALVLCTDGLYPVRKAIAADRKVDGLSVTDKIRNLISFDISIYGGKYGWQVLLHGSGNKVIVNVPTNEDVSSYQYVMNSQTGSWTKFTGWTAFCFEVAQDTLYMGGNGTLVKADSGADDGGANITCQAKQAYNYFGSRGLAKHMKLIRPVLTADRAYHIAIGADTDFRMIDIGSYRGVTAGLGDFWAFQWAFQWSGSPAVSLNWYGISGIGHSVAPRLNVQNDGASIQWSASDLVYEVGGVVA